MDDPAEREAFAAHMRKRHAYEYVYWNGAGQPSAKRPNTPYSEGWVPCDEQWAAWLARASLAHPAATAREEAWKAMVEALEGLLAANDGDVWGAVDTAKIAARRALALARSTGGSNG